jgi:hypothetical protein
MTRSRILLLSSFSLVAVGAALALSVFVLGPARAAVGPLPAEALALPAGSRVLTGFELARVIQSPLYERLRADRNGDPFKELRDKTGLDPARDLDRVILASGGAEGRRVAMAFGRFDRYALGRALEGRKGVTWQQHAGTTLYLFDESSRSAGALAFLGDDVVVAGERAAVEQTLDNHQSGASLRANAELMALVERVKPGSAFWLVGDHTALSKLPGTIPAPGAAPGSGAQLTLPAVKGVIVTGELDPVLALDLTADAADAVAAGKLADVVRGLLALVSLQASQKPELQQLASAVSVTTEGARVKVGLRLPYELFDALKQASAPPPRER